jgi:WG repeat protein
MKTSTLKPLLPFVFIVLASTFALAQSPQTPSLRPVQQDGKWGYIDSSGKIAIKPQFASAEEFSEGLAAIENEDGKYGYIDVTGRVVIEPKFDNCTDFSEGLAAVSLDFEWGYIDKTGNWAIPPQFMGGRPFSDGLALVGVPLNGQVTFPPGPMKHVFIDKTGKIAIDTKDDILNGTFSEGVATVQFITKTGVNNVLIDSRGKTLATVQEIDTFGISEGLVPAQKDEKWGYMDTSGRFVIEPQYDGAHSFSEGLAGVLVGKKWGFIDRSGRFVIRPKYTLSYDGRNHQFSEGLALVYLQTQCAYIDKTGKMLIKVACSDAEKFVGGIASVRTGEEQNEKRGYINKLGKFVWGPVAFKYRSMEEISARAKKEAKDEEVLTPLTAKEQALNARDIILNQPDFVADLNFFVGEGFGGFGGAQRLARKGNRYREESQFWIFVGELGQPSAKLFPQAKVYDDYEPARGGSADSPPINPQALAREENVTFTLLGSRVIDGHHSLKIEAVRNGKPEKFYFYAARDLQNLVIVTQLSEPGRSTLQRLSNISLDVPDSLVQIPADYKPIEHDRWTRIETARVTYGGRVAKDAKVFRAPGGQLFMRVNDWTYLVRPDRARVEVAFQGLLVTRSGEFAWQTNATEAYSLTHYRNVEPLSKWEKEEDKRVIVKPNSVKFRSIDYERDKAMIEIRW